MAAASRSFLSRKLPREFSSTEVYTPKHLAEKILTSKNSLEGERKQVTVLFADPLELLDVRRKDEAASGHLINAVGIPLAELPAAAKQFPDTKFKAPIVVYDGRGGADAIAAARLLIKADRKKSEKGMWRPLSEGLDNDRDEAWNEDGVGGVDLNPNFPFQYRHFAPWSGRFPVSEIETLMLAEFIVAHPQIGLVFTFGAADNLAQTPRSGPSAGSGEGDEPDRRHRKHQCRRSPRQLC